LSEHSANRPPDVPRRACAFDLPTSEVKGYTGFQDRKLQRPAVRKVLERERICC